MKSRMAFRALFLVIFCALSACADGKLPSESVANLQPVDRASNSENAAQKAATAPLRLVQKIPLPDVNGRIDHMALDLAGQRLFVAALGNNTLEVIDVKTGRRIESVAGFREPQGVGYVPESNQIVVANGGDGAVTFLDGSSLKPFKVIRFSGDADNVRYDAARKRFYVGYGAGALGVLDEKGGRVADVSLDGHPESFQLDSAAGKIFVNIPTRHEIAVVDANKLTVTATWPVSVAGANYPMALDEAYHRLLVVSRKPSRLLVYDTETGRLVSNLKTDDDCDDVFYDSVAQRVYASFGQGTVTVYQKAGADQYDLIAEIRTAGGARTSFFSSELGRLYVAAPHRLNPTAEIYVYEVAR